MNRERIQVSFLSTARQAAEVLQKGSLVIIPTDTVYGIAADPRVPGAMERLYEAKGRNRSKPIPLLAASIVEVEKYGAIFGELERKLAERFWPGPLTLVLEIRDQRSDTVAAVRPSQPEALLRRSKLADRGPTSTRSATEKFKSQKFEGFRVPDNDVALAVLREAGGILRVTSANRSGEPPALTAQEAIHYLGSFVDVVLDAGTVSGGTPSTVVKVENGQIKILREGAIAGDALSGVREA